ncbi:hypothetical protein BH23ACI1_BH23ACI1_23660 [soil metagenome]
MRTIALYRSLGAIDARTVARDSLLRWMVVLAPAFGLLFRFGAPPATAVLRERFGFDLEPYYVLLMSFLPLAVAGLMGSAVGFLLLDQRDDQTLTGLLVTPVSLGDYLRYRMAVLLLPTVALSCLALALAGLTPVTPLQLVVTAIVAAPIAAIYGLSLASFAANKVQGFALVKGAGIVLLPALLSYFVAWPWQMAFGLVPHYWPLKVFWLFDAGAVAAALGHGVLGLTWQGVVLVLLARRFSQVVRR